MNIIKRRYVRPVLEVEVLKVEKGFAASDTFEMQQFQYDVDENNPGNLDNTAW